MPGASSPPPSAAETFRPAILDDLLHELGRDRVVSLIGVFLRETAARIRTMTAADASRDVMASNAHVLKSSAASFGCLALAACATAIDAAFKDGRDAEAQEATATLPSLLADADSALRAYLTQTQSRAFR